MDGCVGGWTDGWLSVLVDREDVGAIVAIIGYVSERYLPLWALTCVSESRIIPRTIYEVLRSRNPAC